MLPENEEILKDYEEKYDSISDIFDMTEEEAKEYCENYASLGEWEANDLKMSLEEGHTYLQIAYELRNG